MQNFLLYDFFTPEGYVNENVFAYSNRADDPLTGTAERGLVLYNNKFAEARGWIRTSAVYAVKAGHGDSGEGTGEHALVQKTLGDGLGLRSDGHYYCIFRDYVTGLDYIRNCHELHDQGLYVELGAFKYQVCLDFREVKDDEAHHYAQLAGYLGGRGTPNIEEALREMLRQPEPIQEPAMRFPRSSGILLHPISLPGRFGIGDLGDAAFRFVDFLADSGQQSVSYTHLTLPTIYSV